MLSHAGSAASCRSTLFNEWKKTPGGKQPYAIVGADGLPLAMASLWEWQHRPDLHNMTTVPNELCGAIHDRMPVILPREKWATWLGEYEVDPDELRWMILRPYPAALIRAYPVGVRVGNVRNNDATVLDEISLAA